MSLEVVLAAGRLEEAAGEADGLVEAPMLARGDALGVVAVGVADGDSGRVEQGGHVAPDVGHEPAVPTVSRSPIGSMARSVLVAPWLIRLIVGSVPTQL